MTSQGVDYRDRPGTPVTESDGSLRPDVLLVKVADAMRILNLSKSVIYDQIRRGRLRTVSEGRARLIPATALRDYVDLLLREAQDHGS